MSSLGLSTIVKNEEKILEQSLNSIKEYVDEMIITDTGSTDKTINIATQFTNTLYNFLWIDDFAAACNYSKERINSDYFFEWDADFYIDPISGNKLKELKEREFEGANLIFLNWIIEYGNNGKPRKSVTRPLIAKTSDFIFQNKIHVSIVPKEGVTIKPLIKRDISILHMKNKVEKAHRYSQSMKIVKDILDNDPYNSKYLFCYSEELIHASLHREAVEYLEKYISLNDKVEKELRMIAVEKLIICKLYLKNNDEAIKIAKKYKDEFINFPRFILIFADVLSLVNKNMAFKYYLKYLDKNFTNSDTLSSYDIERFFVYPRIKVARLIMENEKINTLAQTLLKEALNVTTLKKTSDMIESILIK